MQNKKNDPKSSLAPVVVIVVCMGAVYYTHKRGVRIAFEKGLKVGYNQAYYKGWYEGAGIAAKAAA